VKTVSVRSKIYISSILQESSYDTIILKGRETLIYRYGNCLSERGYDYGLRVFVGSSSKIQIVSPSTKESISKGNRGRGGYNF